MALEFPQDEWQVPNNQDNSADTDGEFFVLMSLALDGMLSEDEECRFHRAMEQDPSLANEWQCWQDLGSRFDEEPSLMPPVDFVDKVAAGLVLQQRRSKLRLGIFVGAITTAAWFLLLFALVGAGAYVAMYQGPWLGDQIANLTILTSNIATWISIASDNLTRIFNVNVGPYQMWGMVCAYIAAATFVLGFWTKILRRSIERNSVGQAATS